MNNSAGPSILTPSATRRSFLKGALGAAAAAGLAACGSVSPNARSASSSSGGGKKLELTMFAFLGGDLAVMPKEFADDYTRRHPNVKIKLYEQSNAVGYGKMLAQHQADPTHPLVNFGFFNAQTTVQGIGDKMWVPLDYSAMSNAKDILPSFQRSDHMGIGIGSDQLGLVYTKGKLAKKPAAWSDLWNGVPEKTLSFFAAPWYAVLMAAKANGGDENNMDPGFKLWQEHAKLIRLEVTSNPQYLNVLSDGTAPLTAYFAGTATQWIQGGAPLEYVVPTEGAVPVPCYLTSVADNTDDQKAVVQDIINEMISPKWASRWAETAVQVPANSKATAPKEFAHLPAFAQSTVDKFVHVDWNVIGHNQAAWTERWNSDVVSRI